VLIVSTDPFVLIVSISNLETVGPLAFVNSLTSVISEYPPMRIEQLDRKFDALSEIPQLNMIELLLPAAFFVHPKVLGTGSHVLATANE
jgi:hypothetical protein